MQIYKIFINERPLFITNEKEMNRIKSYYKNVLTGRYLGKKMALLNYVDLMEKSQKYDAVILYFDDVRRLYKDFKGHFKLIGAAGGLVYNTNQDILAIYRRGWWDLPKGKIDKGEKKKAAAIREVQEETGLDEVTLHSKITTTLHTYKDRKGKRILKKSWWYYMTTPEMDLIPQTEEDIELCEWIPLSALINERKPIYGSILDVAIKMAEKDQIEE